MEEIWKPVVGYEGLYEVSNLGNVKSLRFINKLMKKTNHNQGYRMVGLSKEGIKNKSIHRLDAIAFIPNPENKPQVNHINGIKSDNRIENLEWTTQSENMIHSYRILGNKNNLLNDREKYHFKGLSILQINKYGEIVKQWSSIRSASYGLGISESNICVCCKGKRKLAGGFSWKYA